MTSIGKALVIMITALQVILMTISTATFATRKDWKGELKSISDDAGNIEADIKYYKSSIDDRQRAKTDAEATRKSLETDYLVTKIPQVRAETRKLTQDNEAGRTAVYDLRKKANAALAEAKTQAEEVGKVQAQIAALTKQKADFDNQNQVLADRIINLKRQIGVAKTNQADLQPNYGVGNGAVLGVPAN